jgi:FkbM family methyltransferase
MQLKLKLYSLLSKFEFLDRAIASARDYLSYRKYARSGTFSQHGEDQFFKSYFGRSTGTYIDIGASHPFRISNTYLLYSDGWSGVVVEPIKRLCDLHRKWRPRDSQCCVAMSDHVGEMTFYELTPSVLSTFDKEQAEQSMKTGAILRSERPVPVWSLASLCDKYFSDREIDLLSIDAEGLDYAILSGGDWTRYRPRMVVFEFNGDQSTQTPTDELLIRVGYRFLKSFGCNKVYVIN